MTDRPTIAAMYLQGLLAHPNKDDERYDDLVSQAYRLAYALIKEHSRTAHASTTTAADVNETADVSATRIDDIEVESPFKHGDSNPKHIPVTEQMVERFQEIMYDEPVDPNLARAVLNIILNGVGK